MFFIKDIYNEIPIIDTINSVTGKVIHIPVNPHIDDRKNAIGIISISPLVKEIICAGIFFSTDVKNVEKTILKPAKNIAVKYNFSPVTDMFCNSELFSLLNIEDI